MNLWLIGSGPMARDYVKVLKTQGIEFCVIGRGGDSARSFEEAMGVSVQTGGLERAILTNETPDAAIVAVGVEQLTPVTSQLLKSGTKRILLEKPGGLNVKELSNLAKQASALKSEVLLAYNRRFYTATKKAEELIQEDGGLTSFHFEFTEWSHQIQHLKKAPGVKEHWALGNSSHVLDLAFFLGGFPQDWRGWSQGGITWHPTAARFCGAGITNKDALFSYFADWEAPGRWGVELLTRSRRLILRPMEKLQVTSLGSVRVEPVELDDQLDLDFKPGLYLQTKAFLENNADRFCTLAKQVEHAKLYSQIAGYL